MVGGLTIRREWAMPSADTCTIKPIADLLSVYLPAASVSVDPFARNSRLATYRNDLNPETCADWHLPAEGFCATMAEKGVTADVVLFDPPYSPRQISEVYTKVGIEATTKDTQNAALYKRVRDGLDAILKPGGVAISCGWNSAGFGLERGYEPLEIVLVAHGGAHNDTIVVVERKMAVEKLPFTGGFDDHAAPREMLHPPRLDCQAEGWHLCTPERDRLSRRSGRMEQADRHRAGSAENETFKLER